MPPVSEGCAGEGGIQLRHARLPGVQALTLEQLTLVVRMGPMLVFVRGSVTVHMEAPVGQVWDLVSDVTRVGEFSPETFDAEWLAGATGPQAGARFRGHVRRNGWGPVYWTTCTVVVCDPGREFTFAVMWPGDRVINTWSYQLAPSADGIDVTESFELSETPLTRLYWVFAGHARRRTNVNGMRTTLERIKAVVESETSPT